MAFEEELREQLERLGATEQEIKIILTTCREQPERRPGRPGLPQQETFDMVGRR
ncbi:MAG: hypothetical protein GX044_04775 [Firmicutes bacterium]|nr:hypothetical protein [Bacillota bacterium]